MRLQFSRLKSIIDTNNRNISSLLAGKADKAQITELNNRINEIPVSNTSNYVLSKSAVEEVLTGEISSHTHAGGGLTQPQIMARNLGC